jgi:hypothetical protein
MLVTMDIGGHRWQNKSSDRGEKKIVVQ